eukprot:1315198-Amorphochlora_amoeboformis.AAC.1
MKTSVDVRITITVGLRTQKVSVKGQRWTTARVRIRGWGLGNLFIVELRIDSADEAGHNEVEEPATDVS